MRCTAQFTLTPVRTTKQSGQFLNSWVIRGVNRGHPEGAEAQQFEHAQQ